MKKILLGILVVAMLLLPLIGNAATGSVTQTVTLQWNYTLADLSNVSGWNIYWSPTSGSGWIKLASVPYTYVVGTTTTVFTSAQVVTVTGNAPGTVTEYFVVTATNASFESDYSNIVSNIFTIPNVKPPAPTTLIIKSVGLGKVQ